MIYQFLKKYFLTGRMGLLALSLAAFGVGCIQISGGGEASRVLDGGVWKSADRGANFVQKALVPTVGAQKKSIGAANVETFAVDPQDHNAVYIGTAENGLFYTLDGAESWMQVKALASGRVPSVAIDPKNKCVIYAASANKVLKSSDCSRTWQTVYFETRTDKIITAIAVDLKDGRSVYAGTSAGDVLMSSDYGNSWVAANVFKSEIKKILVAPYDSKVVYAAAKTSGVWRSADAGANWKDISEGFKQFAGASEYRDLALDLSAAETLVYASKFGLLRSIDGGANWNKIDLLTPPGAATIYSLAVNPKDGKEIYYGTATTFYRTTDGGKTWRTRKLPTSRAATALMIDPEAANVLYLGVTRLKQ
ncbi:hypothetical protein HYT45_03050 [Candidatus Uhrbacteria bacterium]|nr:hypothetical protein [Candidatus Uhrbacteria bacterium]